MKKVIGGFLGVLVGVLAIVAVAGAAPAEQVQPATIIRYSEPVEITGTLTVSNPGYFPQGVHIGSTTADAGGVTYFNGTIVNASEDADGNDTIPVTFGDDVRIDGIIYRSEEGGDNPLKIADSLRPTADAVYSFGTSDYQFLDAYLSGTVTAAAYAYGTAQTRYWSIGGSELIPAESEAIFTKGSGCLSSTDDSFTAPVNLPQGAVVTKLAFNYSDTDDSDEFNVGLIRSKNGADETMATAATSGSTSGWRTAEDASVVGATVDNSEYSYRTQVGDGDMNNGATHQLCAIEVSYTVTSPLP
ncbi:hypothetical protein KJ903_05940 [Patescibacteria group bacterium]|nr:hypothetical protein [Patescibacteria group bacterium]